MSDLETGVDEREGLNSALICARANWREMVHDASPLKKHQRPWRLALTTISTLFWKQIKRCFCLRW